MKAKAYKTGYNVKLKNKIAQKKKKKKKKINTRQK